MNLFLAGLFTGMVVSGILFIVFNLIVSHITRKTIEAPDAAFLPEECEDMIHDIVKTIKRNERQYGTNSRS